MFKEELHVLATASSPVEAVGTPASNMTIVIQTPTKIYPKNWLTKSKIMTISQTPIKIHPPIKTHK